VAVELQQAGLTLVERDRLAAVLKSRSSAGHWETTGWISGFDWENWRRRTN
jgi:hypothetical protein